MPTLPELLLALPQDDAPIEWMGLQRQEDCHLSVVSMGEIGRGIARRRASDPGFAAELGHDSADLLIAATALEHGLTVVTRNLRHFVPTGVATLNPWRGS